MTTRVNILQRPRIEEFKYCLECRKQCSHSIRWEGNKKFYHCQNCGQEIWVYIEPVGPWVIANDKQDKVSTE